MSSVIDSAAILENNPTSPITDCDGERGAVLIITAFLLLLVMIFLAFEFDIGRLGIAQVEHKRAAAIGSLAAIHTYWSLTMEEEDRPVKKRHDAAIEQARSVAETVLGTTANVPLFIESDGRDPEIVISNDPLLHVGANTKGILRFGHWHYAAPKQGCSKRAEGECPCSLGKWQGPCFEPLQGRASEREFATAIQLEYFTSENNPLRYIFASVFGQYGTAIRARATASLLSDAGVLSSPRLVESSILPVSGIPPDRSVLAALYERLDQKVKRRERKASRRKKGGCAAGIKQWKTAGFYKFATPAKCSTVNIWVWGAGGAASARVAAGAADGGAGGLSFGVLKQNGSTLLDLTVGSGGRNPCVSPLDGPTFGGGGSSSVSMGEGGGYSAVYRGAELLALAGGGGAAGLGEGTADGCRGPAYGGAGGGLVGGEGGLIRCGAKVASAGDSQRPGLGPNADILYRGKKFQGGAGGGGGGLYGGGGSSADYGGAAGGSGYSGSVLSSAIITAANGRTAPYNQLSQYRRPAGEGGSSADTCRSNKSNGQDGLITISWGE